MMATLSREKLFTMRMNDLERARFEAVARYYDLNIAGLLRMIVKRETNKIRAKKKRAG